MKATIILLLLFTVSMYSQDKTLKQIKESVENDPGHQAIAKMAWNQLQEETVVSNITSSYSISTIKPVGNTYIIQAPVQQYQNLDNRKPLTTYPYGKPGTVRLVPTTYTIMASPIITGTTVQIYKN